MSSEPLPLAGVRVIDITHFLAGPYLTRCLAALGAEVIKVERPPAGEEARSHPYHVDGQSGYFLQQNMGKKGVCLNLKDPRGLEVLRRLVRIADALIENYRPGVLDRLGLGYAELSAILGQHNREILCTILGYSAAQVAETERDGVLHVEEAVGRLPGNRTAPESSPSIGSR